MRKTLLFVVGVGGPPLEHLLPRLRKCADVHALVIGPSSDLTRRLLTNECRSVRFAEAENGDVVDEVVDTCQRIGADGVVTFSEFTVSTVAQACVRLGMPGAGPNVRYSRDKYLMRSRWAEAGVNVPRFRRVRDERELAAARDELKLPFLLKPSGRGGAIGQRVITADTDLGTAWRSVRKALSQAAGSGIVEHSRSLDVDHCVAEEIIESTIESWYDEPSYADFLSVEGVVARGVYHPISITSRFRTVPPFIETGAQTPSVLPEHLQRKIEECAREAVDALRLETCGTHTEIKLMPNNELCLLESSARFGGIMVVGQVEHVFGIDMVTLLAKELLGEPQEYPERMLVGGDRSAASIFIIAADSHGNPWRTLPKFAWSSYDWHRLVSPRTTVEVVPSLSRPSGERMLPYHPVSGAMSSGVEAFLVGSDVTTLREDAYRIMDNLESTLD